MIYRWKVAKDKTLLGRQGLKEITKTEVEISKMLGFFFCGKKTELIIIDTILIFKFCSSTFVLKRLVDIILADYGLLNSKQQLTKIID